MALAVAVLIFLKNLLWKNISKFKTASRKKTIERSFKENKGLENNILNVVGYEDYIIFLIIFLILLFLYIPNCQIRA